MDSINYRRITSNGIYPSKYKIQTLPKLLNQNYDIASASLVLMINHLLSRSNKSYIVRPNYFYDSNSRNSDLISYFDRLNKGIYVSGHTITNPVIGKIESWSQLRYSIVNLGPVYYDGKLFTEYDKLTPNDISSKFPSIGYVLIDIDCK